MKRILAIFFFIVFSTQIFPLKEIGEVLWKGSNMEEVHEHSSCGKTNLLEDHVKLFWLHSSSVKFNLSDFLSKFSHIHMDEVLYKILHADVRLQPPNA